MEEPLKRRELDFSDYWRMILKRKVLVFGLCLVFAIGSAVVSFLLPSVYRGDYILNIATSPSMKPSAAEFIRLIGNIDENKAAIFADNADAIRSVAIREVKATNQLRVVIDASRAELFPEAFKKVCDYMVTRDGIQTLQQELRKDYDRRIRELSEVLARSEKMERILLDPGRGKQIMVIGVNPVDISKKIYEMKTEIARLERECVKFSIVDEISGGDTQGQRVKPERAKIVVVSAIIGLLLGITIAFGMEGMERRTSQPGEVD